jgi:hypothetical protein
MPPRIMCFTDRPDALLIFIPDGEVAPALPALKTPFIKGEVAQTLALAGLEVRVSESISGRWTPAIRQANDAARAERGQRQRQAEATEAALLRGSSVAAVRDRADAIRQKLEVDDRIRALKDTISKAKSEAASRGRYMDPREFRRLEQELSRLKDESQALQTQLGEIRKQAHEAWKNERKESSEMFRKAAHALLSQETFEQIELAALDLLEGAREA